MRAVPAAGNSHERRMTFAKKSNAHTTAMPVRIALAGSVALTSVYVAPVINLFSLSASA